jgi:ABC-type uncharacterized transport system involved in gliding motility auxiliary subunit
LSDGANSGLACFKLRINSSASNVFNLGTLLNGDIFLNSVQWLASGETATLSIRAKEPENRRINLNPLQANAIFWIGMVVMPLVGFTLAGLTWWQRR